MRSFDPLQLLLHRERALLARRAKIDAELKTIRARMLVVVKKRK